jgi:hypothetical protein
MVVTAVCAQQAHTSRLQNMAVQTVQTRTVTNHGYERQSNGRCLRPQ